MIGDKLMNTPRTIGDARQVYYDLELEWDSENMSYILQNATKLVEMNNELYDKFKNPTWLKEKLAGL